MISQHYHRQFWLTCVFVSSIFTTLFARTFVHPGVFNTQAELDLIRDRVSANKEPWKSEFTKLSTWPALTKNPQPLSVIGSEEDALTFRQAGHNVYCHALQWAIGGNAGSAEKAISFLNDWANLKEIKEFRGSWGAGNAAHLKTSWAIAMLIGGAEIIRHYRRDGKNAGWKSDDISKFEAMARDVLYPFYVYQNKCGTWSAPGCAYSDSPEFSSNPVRVSNWETTWCTSRMALATFISDTKRFDESVEYVLWCLPRYVFPSGQCGESCRDCTHNEMGLIGLIEAAEIAWKQGVDVYGAKDNRLAKGMEYKAAQFFGGVSTVCRNATSMKSCPGKGVIPGWEIGLNHYKNRAKISMPTTQKYVETKARPEAYRWNFPGGTTLTHAMLDASSPVSIRTFQPAAPPAAPIAASRIGTETSISIDGRRFGAAHDAAVILRLSPRGKTVSIVPVSR